MWLVFFTVASNSNTSNNAAGGAVVAGVQPHNNFTILRADISNFRIKTLRSWFLIRQYDFLIWLFFFFAVASNSNTSNNAAGGAVVAGVQPHNNFTILRADISNFRIKTLRSWFLIRQYDFLIWLFFFFAVASNSNTSNNAAGGAVVAGVQQHNKSNNNRGQTPDWIRDIFHHAKRGYREKLVST